LSADGVGFAAGRQSFRGSSVAVRGFLSLEQPQPVQEKITVAGDSIAD
jgi:hypothetical protein